MPEIEHLIEKRFHGLISTNKLLGSLNFEIHLNSTSSTEPNFHYEITRITPKIKENLEMCPCLKTC